MTIEVEQSDWTLSTLGIVEEDIVAWAENEIYLPADTVLPGRIKILPYQKEMLRTFMRSDCRQSTWMMSTQLGKTTGGQIIIGYAIARGRSSIFNSHATERDIMKFKLEKFDPMVDACPVLRDKVSVKAPGRAGKKGKNNQVVVNYLDGHLTFAHSHSSSSMRSSSAELVIADEVDEYPGTTDSSDPLVPLIARTLSFGRSAKILLISTPKIAETTIIGRQYEKGDKRQYFVPCFACNELQTFGRDSISVNDEGDLFLVCKVCGSFIEEKYRRQMVYDGYWQAEKEFKGHASFHLNQLYSLLSPIQALFDMYTDIESMGFYNNFLAIPWSQKVSDPIEPKELFHHIVSEEPEIFKTDLTAITCGVDVQQDRLEYQIVKWSGDLSYVVIHKTIDYPMYEDLAWKELARQLAPWDPDKVYVDGGYRFDKVKEGLDTYFAAWVMREKIEITKGRSTKNGSFGLPIVGSRRSGYTLLSPDEAKSRIFFDMVPNNMPLINGAGVVTDFLEELTAEHLEAIPTRTGDERLTWVNHRDRNEALDCYVLNLAAKLSLGIAYRRMVLDYSKLLQHIQDRREENYDVNRN